MQSLTKDEINFLIAVNASEESTLRQLRDEFKAWDCEESLVLVSLQELIKNNVVAYSVRKKTNYFDIDKEISLTMPLESESIILYLTPTGKSVWETYDWGITTKRARELVFSNKLNQKCNKNLPNKLLVLWTRYARRTAGR